MVRKLYKNFKIKLSMKKLLSLLLLFISITSISSAQDKISKGTTIKILEIGKTDAYYSERVDFLGKDATALGELLKKSNGFYTGTIETKTGRTCFFTDVKVSINNTSSSSLVSSSSTTTVSKTPKIITGTIKSGTSVYVAEISPDDSYYSDRFTKIGSKGKVDKDDLTMKEDGYYAGSFLYDDGTTAYFYKAKFSKEPVAKLEKTDNDVNSENSTPSLNSSYVDTDSDWESAKNDDDIKEGDKVEVTALSPEDSYYEDKEDYLGKQGIAGNDLEYDSEAGGYGGSVKLDDGNSPYFYLVKLKKTQKTSYTISESKITSTTTSEIKKGTHVIVIDLDTDDSFYSSKDKYVRKKGKVADGLNQQGDGFYSGKILFDDGTDAYFFKVKVRILD